MKKALTNNRMAGHTESLSISLGGFRPCQSGAFFMPKMGRYYFNGRGREQAYNTFGKTCTRILESESAPDRPYQTPFTNPLFRLYCPHY